MLTVNPHEAEPEALLQTEDTRKQTVVRKKKYILRQSIITNVTRVLKSNITNIVRCRRKRH